MTKALFKRKSSNDIENLPVEDGSLIYDYQTGATYLDYNNERIPTGGGNTIESGSNEKGNWIKYNDGTLIQYSGEQKTQDVTANSYWDYRINFPISFFNTSYFAICSDRNDSKDIKTSIISTNNTSSFYVRLRNGASYQQSIKFSWFAVGRWK